MWPVLQFSRFDMATVQTSSGDLHPGGVLRLDRISFGESREHRAVNPALVLDPNHCSALTYVDGATAADAPNCHSNHLWRQW